MLKADFNAVKKILKTPCQRIALSIARAIIRIVDDSLPIQSVQIALLGDETRDRVERIQEYGFTSVPFPGCRSIAVFVGGDRSHGIVIACDDPQNRKRNMQAGEVAIYTDEGDYILLKRGRIIEVNTETLLVKASQKVRIETPIVETTGDMIDRVNENSNTMRGMRNIYNTHMHPENDNGGPTGTPTKVM